MSSYTILVVDDIYYNRIILTEVIKSLGYNCIECDNGKKAIEILNKTQVHMMFLDLEMPVLNGLETIDHIRHNMSDPTCSIPIVAITAHNPSLFFADHKEAGFNQIIRKPYSIMKVQSIINSLLKPSSVKTI